MLDLHYWPTPNGKKVTIQLEECGLDYNVIECNIGKGDQFTDEFLAINPNNRMPTLVDHAPEDGNGPLSVFESGAIMLYLANSGMSPTAFAPHLGYVLEVRAKHPDKVIGVITPAHPEVQKALMAAFQADRAKLLPASHTIDAMLSS